MKPNEVYQYVKSHIQSGAYDLAGDELFLACPSCGNENHFSVNIKVGMYNCFKCEVGGRLASQIVNDKLEWKRLTKNMSSGNLVGSKRNDDKIELPKVSFEVHKSLYPDGTEPKVHVKNSLNLCKRAFEYCVKRGLTNEQIRDYRVYIVPQDPRVYFPYWNANGEVTHYMGRKMMGSDDTLKTKDAGNSEKPLFGRHVNVHKDFVVLVEGVFDHFVTAQSYALMGSSVNEDQMLQLRADGVSRVFVIGDPDASASATRQAKKLRGMRFSAFPVFLHSTKDPAELGRETMYGIVDELYKRKDRVFRPIHVGVGDAPHK